MSTCICPPGAIQNIDNEVCGVKFNLITRFAIQKKQATIPFADLTSIQTEANWDVFLAAADDTTIQFSPRFANTELPPSEAITFGGDDNTTPDGNAVVIGETNPSLSAQFYDLDPIIIAQLKALECQNPNLSIYLIDADGALMAKKEDGGGTGFQGLPITSFFIGTKGLGGRTDPDASAFNFSLSQGWDTTIQKIEPSFDILNKLN